MPAPSDTPARSPRSGGCQRRSDTRSDTASDTPARPALSRCLALPEEPPEAAPGPALSHRQTGNTGYQRTNHVRQRSRRLTLGQRLSQAWDVPGTARVRPRNVPALSQAVDLPGTPGTPEPPHPPKTASEGSWDAPGARPRNPLPDPQSAEDGGSRESTSWGAPERTCRTRPAPALGQRLGRSWGAPGAPQGGAGTWGAGAPQRPTAQCTPPTSHPPCRGFTQAPTACRPHVHCTNRTCAVGCAPHRPSPRIFPGHVRPVPGESASAAPGHVRPPPRRAPTRRSPT